MLLKQICNDNNNVNININNINNNNEIIIIVKTVTILIKTVIITTNIGHLVYTENNEDSYSNKEQTICKPTRQWTKSRNSDRNFRQKI